MLQIYYVLLKKIDSEFEIETETEDFLEDESFHEPEEKVDEGEDEERTLCHDYTAKLCQFNSYNS